MYKFGILGVGKMGGAILDGVVSSNIYDKKDILLYSPSEATQNNYKNKGFSFALNEKDLFLNSKIILISIKPQKFDEVLPIAKDIDFNDRCIISIAAGKSISNVSSYFKNATIIRAMPNLPASIKEGSITVSLSEENELSNDAINILSSIGVVKKIKENEMDDTLALNGSMPAYAYLFAKAFIDYAVKKGIDYDVALDLTTSAIKGSMDMILANKDTPIQTLIDNVCSKGGTTIAGLNKLYENDFEKAIYECSEACSKRSKELGK
jgi:pyrroline-5-carboxylate reductase